MNLALLMTTVDSSTARLINKSEITKKPEEITKSEKKKFGKRHKDLKEHYYARCSVSLEIATLTELRPKAVCQCLIYK